MARGVSIVSVALLGLALGLGGVGCGHTHTTDAQRTDENDKSDKGGNAQQDLPKSKGPDKSAHHAVPIATAPEGLLKPGAEDKIREKLKAGGFLEGDDGSVNSGLVRFQRKHDLPATGAPDAETLRKLGLDPDQLLRKSSSSDAH
jgi:hypothetical protein